MQFEFTIPIRLEDLKTKQSVTGYVVNEVFSTRIQPNKLTELKNSLKDFTENTIIDHFDTLYSVIVEKAKKEDTVLHNAWSSLMKCLESLTALIRTSQELTARNTVLRNSVSMILYLATEYTEYLETLFNQPSTEQIVAGKKKRVKQLEKGDKLSLDWMTERQRVVKNITQLLNLPVQRLWDPPIVDQNIINCVGNCCFKLLHCAETVKLKDTKDEIFGLLGTIIKRHKYSLTAAIQIMECLKLYEHMASTMSEALSVFVREFSSPKTTQDVLREISSLSTDYLQKDSNAARTYSIFLVELADMLPDVILPVISVLMPFLDNDPHTMRNAMLTMLGKLVMNLLTGDNLDENHKNMREEFIETLCEHTHDCNGFVRTKALQVITGLVETRTLPLSHFFDVACLAKERLLDKLSNVRKYSIQLLTTLITHNPYAAKLTDEELNNTLAAEKQKLLDLKSKLDNSSQLTASAVITPAENWQAMLPEIEKAVAAVISEGCSSQDESMDATGDVEEDMLGSLEQVSESIISLLSKCRPAEACRLLLKAQKLFVGTNLELQKPVEDDSRDEESNKEEQIVLDKLMALFLSQRTDCGDTPIQSHEAAEIKEKLKQQQLVVKYLEETKKFCSLLHEAVPTVCKLLTSKAATDVVESVQFVVNVVQFGVTDAVDGLSAMLKLVWAQDANIKTAVVDAFRKLYLCSEDAGSNREPDKIASNLISLTKTFSKTFGQLTSWEQMVAEFVRSEDVNSKVLQILWKMFTLNYPSSTPSDSKQALKLISMASRAKPAIVTSNMDVLLSEGLGPRAAADLLMARDVCFCLLSLVTTLPSKDDDRSKGKQKFAADSPLIVNLINLLILGIDDCTQCAWVPYMEQAIKVLYTLSDMPDVTCEKLIHDLYPKVLSSSKQTNLTVLTRFISLLGHVALCQMTYLETDVLQDLKMKRNKADKERTTENQTGGGDELGTTTSDDLEAEIVMKVIELELLDSKNLLGSFFPLITNIIVNQSSFDDRSLQAAAIIAMGKYMLISPTLCRQNLRLYFTVLERSQYTEVKTNAIIALSDMVFRYPNELEPWTPNLYARLRDPSPVVRKCTLMVLTRLILNDMVKVKGQISEIATCLVDEVLDIKLLASQFFFELANKGKSLYNVLLDIISRLSDPEVGVDESQFRIICSELLGHVSDDRQSESLTERFVMRFRATVSERQWRDLGFCLSKLSYTEKSVKKLIELFPCYADKLQDEDIYENFMAIINAATQKLKPKPGSKELLTELADKIQQAHTKGVEDAETLKNSEQKSDANLSQIRKPSKGEKNVKKRKPKRSVAESDESNDSDESSVSRSSNSSRISVTQKPARRSERKVVPLRNVANLLHDLDEESDEEPITHFTKTPKAKEKTGKKPLVFSSSDEEEVNADAVLTPVRNTRRSVRVRNK